MFAEGFEFSVGAYGLLFDKRSIIEIAFDEVRKEIKKSTLIDKIKNFFFRRRTKSQIFILTAGY